MKKIVVAIDGFSSCGKRTIAKQLAKEFGYIYVDTGAMYRAVSLFCLQKGWLTASGKVDEEALKQQISNIDIAFKTNAEGVQETYLNGKNVEKEIRTLEVANGASIISAIGFVRKELVRQQQLMGQQKGIVMDGRDIGTVVFPTAELKIFVTAQPEVRAHRRHKELEEQGISESFDAVLANVKERDERDQTRKESPLRQASDALLLDNSNLNKEQQMEIVRQWFLERTQI